MLVICRLTSFIFLSNLIEFEPIVADSFQDKGCEMEDLGDFDSNIDMADSIEVKKVLFQVLCIAKLKDYGFEVKTIHLL